MAVEILEARMRVCPASGGRMAADACVRETASAADCEACVTVRAAEVGSRADAYIQGFNDCRKLAAAVVLDNTAKDGYKAALIEKLDAVGDGLHAAPEMGRRVSPD